jgi:hypothetical protein
MPTGGLVAALSVTRPDHRESRPRPIILPDLTEGTCLGMRPLVGEHVMIIRGQIIIRASIALPAVNRHLRTPVVSQHAVTRSVVGGRHWRMQSPLTLALCKLAYFPTR